MVAACVTLLGSFLLEGGLAESASASAHLKAVREVSVKVAVGGVDVSWSPVSKGVVYSVTPVGAQEPSCSVVGKSHCFVPISSLGKWSFRVTSTEGAATARSTATRPIAAHLVVVVAGQSNAEGYTSFDIDPLTGVDYFAPAFLNGADEHDQIVWEPWWVDPAKTAKGKTAKGPVPLDTPQYQTPPQVVNGVEAGASFGPEIGFARQIWADTSTPMTIIKAAYGGTSLAVNWNVVGGSLFSPMVNLVDRTMTNDAAKGQLDVLGAFIWYQGENDAQDPAWAAAYQSNLEALITTLRASLPSASTLPVGIIKESLAQYAANFCQTDCDALAEGDAEVRSADDWAVANLPNVVEVDSIDAPRTSYSFYVHLSDAGELAVGQAIGVALEPLISGLPPAS